jgi:acetyl-CoA synthetase
MSDKVYNVPAEWTSRAFIDNEKYQAMYKRSVEDPNGFWGETGKRIDWIKPYTKVKNTSYAPDNVSIKWYEDGTLNVSANCIDRHLKTRADQVAIIWEGDDPTHDEKITYRQLHERVCKLANVLKAIGGFSPDSLAGRIVDADSKFIITADEGVRGGRPIPLKKNTDEALKKCKGDEKVLVVRRTGGPVPWTGGRDIWLHEELVKVDANCAPVEMGAEDPLFILYTSGSTGKPKGVLHTSGGYLVYVSLTHQHVFDYHDGDIYWCTADVGWVTGHSYILYGPLSNGATTLMFEGVPNYPTASRFWHVIDKWDVNTFYTAPTAIRALMGAGDDFVKRTDRSSLKLLGSVGEPINPEAWEWYHRVVGDGRCPIVDTWWQTETGGILISPLPGATKLKPGSATRPFFGIKPELVDEKGTVLKGAASGNLVILDSWPGQMRSVYRDHERFVQTYFSTYKGMYFTGDGCRRDADGYYWITGRVDDVINVSGHRLGTAEVESALVSHPKVAEAAVVGYPHDIKGQGIYCYVTLIQGNSPSEELKKELVLHVRKEIGPFAAPDQIQFSPGLPKTRSGKIMRRILRKIAEDDFSNLGDTSTLAEPAVVEDLVSNRQNKKRAAAG